MSNVPCCMAAVHDQACDCKKRDTLEARIRELEAERNNLAVKHHEQAATAGKLRDLLDECERHLEWVIAEGNGSINTKRLYAKLRAQERG